MDVLHSSQRFRHRLHAIVSTPRYFIMQQLSAHTTATLQRERNILWVAYFLHALSIFTVWLSSVAGVVVNHIKYTEAEDEVIASHHRWLLRTFWFALLWNIICIPLTFFFVGFIGFILVAIWFIYRLVRGILALVDNKPMPMP